MTNIKNYEGNHLLRCLAVWKICTNISNISASSLFCKVVHITHIQSDQIFFMMKAGQYTNIVVV